MDTFPPSALLFVRDFDRKPGTRVELGSDLIKVLKEHPGAIATIAVDLICATIDQIAEGDERVRLQWDVTAAMVTKLEMFKRMERTFDDGEPDIRPPSEPG